MKIIYYEMRKSWFKISVLAVLAILTLVNVYKFNEVYGIFGRFGSDNTIAIKEAYHQLYSELRGDVSDEEIQMLKENDNRLTDLVMSREYSTDYNPDCYTGYEFGDFALFHFNLVPEIQYVFTYTNISNQIAQRAFDNIAFYESIGEDYQQKYNELIVNMYSEREIPQYYMTEWVEYYFTYDFSSLLALIMIIFGLCSCFCQEKESGMSELISCLGKSRLTAFSKLISAMLYSLVLSVYFAAADFVILSSFCGIDGLNMPIYSSEYFANSPFGFSILYAIIQQAVLRFVALFVISEIILIISELSPNTIVSGVVSFGVIVLLILSAGEFSSPINPIGALTGNTYIKGFECVNLFGEPILELYIAFAAQIMLSLALGAVILISAPKVLGQLRRTKC